MSDINEINHKWCVLCGLPRSVDGLGIIALSLFQTQRPKRNNIVFLCDK